MFLQSLPARVDEFHFLKTVVLQKLVEFVKVLAVHRSPPYGVRGLAFFLVPVLVALVNLFFGVAIVASSVYIDKLGKNFLLNQHAYFRLPAVVLNEVPRALVSYVP